MNITKDLTTINRTVCNGRKIEWIVIHYFGAIGSAKDTCAYFRSVNRSASAHYFVDERGIWQCVEDKNAAWHCGDSGRGAYKGLCSNRNSIGIEIAPRKLSTATMGVIDVDWYFSDEAIRNAEELTRAKMAEYNISADHVIRHFDVTGKLCPRPFVGGDTNRFYGKTGNQMWAEFKKSLEEDAMTGEEIYKAYNEYAAALPVPEWAKAELAEAVAAGVTDGNNPCGMIPRYQAAIMALRAKKGGNTHE